MKNHIILIYKSNIENQKIIEDIQLLKSLNYQKIIIKIIEDINFKNNFLTIELFLNILKRIEKINEKNILWNIEINESNIELLKKLKNKKYPIFIDYFFQEEEKNNYDKIKIYKKNIERLDANISCNVKITDIIFDNIDYYPKNFFQIDKNQIDFYDETIILYYDKFYFLYLFGNERFLKTELSYTFLNQYSFYKKEILKWKLKKQQKNLFCKNCNFFNICNNSGFFIFENPLINCKIQEYLKYND